MRHATGRPQALGKARQGLGRRGGAVAGRLAQGFGGRPRSADILKSLERDTADARTALAHLAKLAGGAFADLPPDRRRDGTATFKQEGGAPLSPLNRVVLLCTYRDDRLMRSLGQEPRSPFPKGHIVEQGDWSLLDPVRKRAPMWRRMR